MAVAPGHREVAHHGSPEPLVGVTPPYAARGFARSGHDVVRAQPVAEEVADVGSVGHAALSVVVEPG